MSTALFVEIGYEIVKVAEREGYLQRLKDAFRKKHRVLLLGSTGTGKTQFLNSFGNIFADALDHVARTEFPHVKRMEIDKKLFEFIDTPGQELHKSRRVSAVRKAIADGFSGVMNLVSYGYHEYGVDKQEVVNNGTVSPEYLQMHCSREVEQLGEWAPLLKNEWVFTVVTKADIWWDDRQQIMNHYASGAYGKALQVASSTTEKVVCPYSSLTSKFYGAVPCSGNFSDIERKSCRNSLFHKLAEAIARLEG